jgi:hypothetical protein
MSSFSTPVVSKGNCGIPKFEGTTIKYSGTPDLMHSYAAMAADAGARIVGGCCGTSTPHIAALDAMLRKLGGAAQRPAPIKRKFHWVPSVASLYTATALRQENSYFSIGERCNANGSKAWRERQAAGDWDGCVAMGREQMAEGSNSLDICTAFVGRDEMAEMSEVIRRFTSSVNGPLVIDSTETPVIEAALKLHGGKPIINSINFEEGEKAAEDRMILARKFGAAVIALTKSLGKELADTGVRVNCVTPAAVKTAIFDQMSPEHIAFMLSKIPMGRFGTPEEVAAMVTWLCTDDCSFSTGAVFDLSGGRSTY